MKQEYAEYLTELARNGDLQAFHQLKRAGVEIELEEELTLIPPMVQLFAHTNNDGRVKEKPKNPNYLNLPMFGGRKKLA